MPTDVIMPQMGESIFEGTITKWLKKPGDTVPRDEPLFEISTDKVDAEIPSPAAGVLAEIKVDEGTTVQVNTVVAVIGEEVPLQQPAPAATCACEAGSPEGRQKPEPPKAAPAPAAPVEAAAFERRRHRRGDAADGRVHFRRHDTKWLKKVGDSVQRDEPLFEISTDKVDAEIPSPSSGTLLRSRSKPATRCRSNGSRSDRLAARRRRARRLRLQLQRAHAAGACCNLSSELLRAGQRRRCGFDGERLRSSPLVRKIAKDINVDLRQVPGTGSSGRITKDDILQICREGRRCKGALQLLLPQRNTAAAAPKPRCCSCDGRSGTSPGELVPLTRMRSIIAQRMVDSKRTSAHVHTVFKVDMTRIVKIREKEKTKYEQRNGVKLTYMPFITRAVVATLRKMPIVNASLEGDAIRYHQNINVGIAVALDWGLIVPVIKQAEDKSFLGLARSIADLAERARAKKLKPDEVGSGTITITNPGIFGEQFGTPIINQPESAILGVGGLFKEPTVLTDKDGNDSIAIRHVIRLTLGFDHRIIDGADAGKFMAEVKKYLENWSEDIG